MLLREDAESDDDPEDEPERDEPDHELLREPLPLPLRPPLAVPFSPGAAGLDLLEDRSSRLSVCKNGHLSPFRQMPFL